MFAVVPARRQLPTSEANGARLHGGRPGARAAGSLQVHRQLAVIKPAGQLFTLPSTLQKLPIFVPAIYTRFPCIYTLVTL